MSNDKLRCPDCKSKKVVVIAETMWMVNTGELYCQLVKSYDSDAKASCLNCVWRGFRNGLVITRKEE